MALIDDQYLARTPMRRPRFMFGSLRQSVNAIPPSQYKTSDSKNTDSPQRPGLRPSRTTTNQLKRSRSTFSPPMSLAKRSVSDQKLSSSRIEIVNPWTDDATHWPATLNNDTPFSSSFSTGSLSPIPSYISPAAAKRLGIDAQGNVPGSAPLNSPIDWSLSRLHHRDASTDTQTTPALDPTTFYSSDSEGDGDARDRFSYSSQSSRTSYQPLTPNTPKWFIEFDHDQELHMQKKHIPFPTPEKSQAEKSNPVYLSTGILDERKNNHTEKQLPPLPAPTPPQSSNNLVQRRPQSSTSLLRVLAAQTSVDDVSGRRGVDLPREAGQTDFEAVLSDRAEAIRIRLRDAASSEVEVIATPPLPKRSSRRLLARSLDLPTAHRPRTAIAPNATEIQDQRQRRAPLPALRVDTGKASFLSPYQVEKMSQACEQQEQPVTPNAAEMVIFKIMTNFSTMDDLLATARINHGFYNVYKRHELQLLKCTIKNQSTAAWECLEAMLIDIPARGSRNARASNSTCPAARYAQSHRRCSYILATLKSMIHGRCQSCLRPETFSILKERNSKHASRFDDALWRIWTFCTIFGSGKGRENDIVGQMDWLRGGSFAKFATSNVQPLRTRASLDNVRSVPFEFGRGNNGGLSVGQLQDMLEMWDCLKTLLQGILGDGRAAQARKHGVFDSIPPELVATAAAADALLDEWYHYLCTLGPSAILELASDSASLKTRVFDTARDFGWTKWSPPINGSSRSGFLRTAIERVLDEFSAASSPRTTIQVRQIRRVQTSRTALNAQPPRLDDASMSQWIKYIAGFEASQAGTPLLHIATQRKQSAPQPQQQEPNSAARGPRAVTCGEVSPPAPTRQAPAPPTEPAPALPARPAPASPSAPALPIRPTLSSPVLEHPIPLRRQSTRVEWMMRGSSLGSFGTASAPPVPARASSLNNPDTVASVSVPAITVAPAAAVPTIMPPMPSMVPLSRFNSVRGDSWVVKDGVPVRESVVISFHDV